MIFRIEKELAFPPVELAEEDGLLCFGGDLSPERLILAYSSGIFPWHDEPPMWYAPDPRMIIDVETWQPSKSLKRIIKKGEFTCAIDTNFEKTITACSQTHGETWISPDFIENYSALHKQGIAHSIEAYQNGVLVGGLYGLSLGGAFFGESMFHTVSNASKVAFAHLIETLRQKGITLLDCQMNNSHLESLGGFDIERSQFMKLLAKALEKKTQLGPWTQD